MFEENLSRKVDFGHTFSYGMEGRPATHLLYGEIVLLDIAISARIAAGRGLLSDPDIRRILALIDCQGLRLETDLIDPGQLWESLEERIHHRNGLQTVPFPDGIGKCVFVNDINPQELQSSVAGLKERRIGNHAGIREC